MTLKRGEMFTAFEAGKASDEHHIMFVTTNATLKSSGALVMGRGAALQARGAYPGIDLEFGQLIQKEGELQPNGFYKYGLLLSEKHHGVGAFQVKYYFRDKAPMDLVILSLRSLAYVAAKKPSWMYYLNYPCIGYGGWTKAEMEPVLQAAQLPDNVWVWEFDRQ